MNKRNKKLSNPFSTGGGGGHFEAHVQASFVVLMLTGGFAPCMPCQLIKKIKLQGKIDGFNTDDLIVYAEREDNQEIRKLLGQVKYSISITKKSEIFSEVIQAAWNDFNNPDIFTKGKDIIALITGPLSATDTRNVQWLLNQSRHTNTADEFFRHVEQANFSPAKSQEKLDVIKHHIKIANNNVDISREDLYEFLNHFYLLGYDLGKEYGVVLSLLYSHISQFNKQVAHLIWSKIVDLVQTWNKDAGTITKEKLPDDLTEYFKQPIFEKIPEELVTVNFDSMQIDWNKHKYANDLALLNLLGAWNEKNEADIEVLNHLLNVKYSSWVIRAQEVLLIPNNPLSLTNGQWKFSERVNFWNLLGSRIFDQNLDSFKDSVVEVLTKRDPSFDLPQDKRFASSVYGKILPHSLVLRKGLADGLAILGNNSKALINCSQEKAETLAVLTVRNIFSNADWVLWGSLNNLLPILAEAAPDEFLIAVENALQLSSCPFDELFGQEGNSISGTNYLTGLLWALEGLAWDEKYIVRVCVILAELACHDPGGNWANRPSNSLITILLPWLPQTIASIEKRKVAIKTVCKECPEIGWELIISLLPNQYQFSSGSYKPVWRNIIPTDWEKGVSNQEYFEQVSFYAELAISMAGFDIEKLSELIDHFNNLPKTSFNKLLDTLSSDEILELREDKRLNLWNKITKFITKHRRFSSSKWALNEEFLYPMEVVADKLAPSNFFNLYQHLFSVSDSDLYDESSNWKEQREKLDKRRQKAVDKILKLGDIKLVIEFAEVVKKPGKVGCSLGNIANEKIDTDLLPEHLNLNRNKISLFIGSYIWSRHYHNGWSWADKIGKIDWNNEQVTQFLCYLPFCNETWIRVKKWLRDDEKSYWLRTNANPYQTDGDLSYAIDKLLEYDRPNAAISCLSQMLYNKQEINVGQCIKALFCALSSTEESYTMDTYDIIELIKMLQGNSEINPDTLFKIEWAYMPLLDSYHGASPKLLYNRLASDPEFFCEIIRLIYRSKKIDIATNVPSEKTKAAATNAWRLLYKWKTLPGIQEDGSFNDSNFLSWIIHVKEICTESGHLEVALNEVGKVLIYSPPDESGLWINHTVANTLNSKDTEDMRNGYKIGIHNSRGVQWVDPTGKPELELAEQYQKKADEVENAGYQRLAVTLRSLSESYLREAERIVSEHKIDVDD